MYQANFGIVPETDVRELNPGEMPDFDIICGGFPCQPFSRRRKETDTQTLGLLFDEIIRLAVAKRPKFMFLENVKHILKVGGGEVFEYIRGKLQMSRLQSLQIFRMSPSNMVFHNSANVFTLPVLEMTFITATILHSLDNQVLYWILKVT